MSYNDLTFIISFVTFLPIYYIASSKIRPYLLLIASYLIYLTYGNIVFILYVTITSFIAAIIINNANKKNKRLLILIIGIICSSFILIIMKYLNFTNSILNTLLRTFSIQHQLSVFEFIMPIGLSFFTLQVIGYLVDVYRGKILPEKNLFHYSLFVSFFPQIISGPINRAESMFIQFHNLPNYTYENLRIGFQYFIWGVFQKMVLADRLSIIVDKVFNNYQDYSGLIIFIAAISFSLQLYCDFSSISNMAYGLSKCLGINVTKNFKTPYFVTSISEFWSQWHISLSTWLRDYVYIPLGGRRKGLIRKYFNLVIVFFVSGLWHGASWNFIIWGLLHAIYQICGDFINKKIPINTYYWFQKYEEEVKLFRIFRTFLLVTFAWIFFRAPSFSIGLDIVKYLFSSFNPWIITDGSLLKIGLKLPEIILLLIMLIVLWKVDSLRHKGILSTEFNNLSIFSRWSIYYIIIFSIIIFGVYGGNVAVANFIYQQF